MAKSLDERYEEAAEKVRSNANATNRKNYHALRDELVQRTREAREARGGAGVVTADQIEAS